MNILTMLYERLVCNKFNYLLIQIILFVMVLTMDSYNVPENEWGVRYILKVALVLLCLLMILRFRFLKFASIFILIATVVSCFSIFYNEVVKLLSKQVATQEMAGFIVQNNFESITTFIISILVIISLTSEQKIASD